MNKGKGKKIKEQSGYKLDKTRSGVRRWKKIREDEPSKKSRQANITLASATRGATGILLDSAVKATFAKPGVAMLKSGTLKGIEWAADRMDTRMRDILIDQDRSPTKGGLVLPFGGNYRENISIGQSMMGKAFLPTDVEAETPGQGIAGVYERESQYIMSGVDPDYSDAAFKDVKDTMDLLTDNHIAVSARQGLLEIIADKKFKKRTINRQRISPTDYFDATVSDLDTELSNNFGLVEKIVDEFKNWGAGNGSSSYLEGSLRGDTEYTDGDNQTNQAIRHSTNVLLRESPAAREYIRERLRDAGRIKNGMANTHMLIRGLARGVLDDVGFRQAVGDAAYNRVLRRTAKPAGIMRHNSREKILYDVNGNLIRTPNPESSFVVDRNHAELNMANGYRGFVITTPGRNLNVNGSNLFSVPNIDLVMLHESVHMMDYELLNAHYAAEGRSLMSNSIAIDASKLDRAKIAAKMKARVSLMRGITKLHAAGLDQYNKFNEDADTNPEGRAGIVREKLRGSDIPVYLSTQGNRVDPARIAGRKAPEAILDSRLISPLSLIPGLSRLDYAIHRSNNVKAIDPNAFGGQDGVLSQTDMIKKAAKHAGGIRNLVGDDEFGSEALTTLTELAIISPHLINSLDTALGTNFASNLKDYYGTDIRTKENPTLRAEIDSQLAKFFIDNPSYMENYGKSMKMNNYTAQLKVIVGEGKTEGEKAKEKIHNKWRRNQVSIFD